MTKKRKFSTEGDSEVQKSSKRIKLTKNASVSMIHQKNGKDKKKLSRNMNTHHAPKPTKRNKLKEKQHPRIQKSKHEDKSDRVSPSHTNITGQAPKSGKVKNEDKVALEYPKVPKTISANWKRLQKELHLGKKKSQKKQKTTKVEKLVTTPTCALESTKSTEPEIWFDGVDEVLIESSRNKSYSDEVAAKDWDAEKNPLVKAESFSGLTKIIAMDCEMVGVGDGGEDSILARVSVVNQFGQCIYDKLVRPSEEVVDYRTQYSGIHEGDLDNGEDFKSVQKDVSDIMKGRILVGHAIHNDLKVLYLDHPKKMIRDTSKYKPFKKLNQGKTPSLKKLSDQILGVRVQEGEHNSVQDAQAAMRLYTMHRKTWEKALKAKKATSSKNSKNAKKKVMPSTDPMASQGNLLDSDEES